MIEKIEKLNVNDIKPYESNARIHPEYQIKQIMRSIEEFGFLNPLLIDKHNNLICGHGRLEAAQRLNMVELPCIRAEHLTDQQRKAFVLIDNRLAETSEWDKEILKIELKDIIDVGEIDLSNLGFSNDEMIDFGFNDLAGIDGDDEEESKAGNLVSRFGVAPFSVLNAREGWWQHRKRAWIALGIKSELGRGGGATWAIDVDGTPTTGHESCSTGV